MSIAHVVVTGSTAAVLSFSVIADHLLRDRVLANMDRAGVPWSWLPTLAGLRIAGALGLIVGLALPAIGIAAAVGVIVYFLAAIVTHLRARWYDIQLPRRLPPARHCVAHPRPRVLTVVGALDHFACCERRWR